MLVKIVSTVNIALKMVGSVVFVNRKIVVFYDDRIHIIDFV